MSTERKKQLFILRGAALIKHFRELIAVSPPPMLLDLLRLAGSTRSSSCSLPIQLDVLPGLLSLRNCDQTQAYTPHYRLTFLKNCPLSKQTDLEADSQASGII